MNLTSQWLTPTYNPLTKMLTSGTRIGSYEIVGSLGSGGMGEVYRARDLKLGREVALKILPDAFANDPDRLMRFEREAKTLASLNHPHIAQIFGLEDGPAEAGTTNRALVMELVEGEDLAQRIARGPIAVDEALPIARQIAEALEAAHDAGIIHRDLKPANIKVRPDATVKVLDFGLAKALESSAHTTVGHAGAGPANLANSPTITSPVGRLRGAGTEIGMILGTAAYMAPEQARGRAVDRRADIWAFGCVLYEMLTGHRAFAGDDLPETMTAIMRDTPAWDALPPSTPDAVRDIVERCLEKDPRTRLQAIGEARVALERALASTQSSVSRVRKRVESPPTTPAPSRAARKWTIGILSALALCGVAAVTMVVVRSRLEPAVTGIFDIAAPARTSLNLVNRPAVSLSRDGSTLAFVARRQGVSRLYVRHRSEGQARALEGTDGASEPVISPNGQWIAFIADARLKRIAVGGGAASIVTEVNDARGLAWRDDNTIILSPGPVGGLAEVDAGGGSLKPLTTTDTSKGERTHRWPHVSSNGRFVLFTVATFHNPDNYETATIERLDLTTGQRAVVLSGARMARFVMDDVIVFARAGELHAGRVDPNTGAVQGQSVLVVQGVNGDPTTGATHFAYGEDGTLAYVAGPAEVGRLRLMWMDYQGVARPTLDPSSVPVGYRDPKLSPDKRRVAATVFSGSAHDIWLYDLTRRTEMRFTFGALGGGPAGAVHVDNVTPVWSADGQYIYYASNSPDSTSSLFRKRADGSREPELVGRLSGVTYLKQVRERPDALLADLITVDRQSDIVLVRLAHDAASPSTNLVSTKADEGAGQLSPNGRWLAYQSDVGGRYDIYVRDIRGNGQWQISTAGGEEPRWSDDGRRLYFRSGTQMMRVEFAPGETLDVTAAPSALFDGVHELRVESVATYDVDDTGQRFLVVSPAEDAERPEAVRVVLGWRSDLRRLLGLGSGRVF